MLRAISLAAACLAPAQAQALSCMPWQVENAYQQAEESDDLYSVVLGRLQFDEADFPVTDWDRQQDTPAETRLTARLDGDRIGANGRRSVIETPVHFVVSCAGPWCPQAVPGDEVIAFLRHTEAGYELELGACGGMMFARPDDETLRRLQSCLDGGACTAPALR